MLKHSNLRAFNDPGHLHNDSTAIIPAFGLTVAMIKKFLLVPNFFNNGCCLTKNGNSCIVFGTNISCVPKSFSRSLQMNASLWEQKGETTPRGLRCICELHCAAVPQGAFVTCQVVAWISAFTAVKPML